MREKPRAALEQLSEALRQRQEQFEWLQTENVRLLRRATALEVLATAAAEVILSLSVATSGTSHPAVAAAAAAAAAAEAAASAEAAAMPPPHAPGAAAAAAAAGGAGGFEAGLSPGAMAAAADAAVTAAVKQAIGAHKAAMAKSAADKKQQRAEDEQQQQQQQQQQEREQEREAGALPEGEAGGGPAAPMDVDGGGGGGDGPQAGASSPAQVEQQQRGSKRGRHEPNHLNHVTNVSLHHHQHHKHAPSHVKRPAAGGGAAAADGAAPAPAPPRRRAPAPLALLSLPRVVQLSATIRSLLEASGGGLAAQFTRPEGGLQALDLLMSPRNIAAALALTPDGALESYTAFVMEVLLLQTLLDRDFEMDSLGAQLAGIMEANLGWIFSAWVWNPLPVSALSTCHLLTRDKDSSPPASHWVKCVRALRPSAQQLMYLGEVRRVVRGQQAGLVRVWRQFAAQLDAAAAAGSYAGMSAALDGLDAVLRRWDVVAVVQAVTWIGAVTPQQMARLCVRAFPYAPTGDAVLEHMLVAADLASAAEAAAQQAAAAAAAAALLSAGAGSGGR